MLRLNLPTPDAPLIVLQVVFAGAIEFDKKRLFFFASLFESRILFITLEGDMGLLLGWGDDPAFVFTVGGFHPRFTPPPLPFPSPRRLALSILDEDAAMVRIDAYFAVTSNTVQVGAHAELRFGFDSFGIQGHFGFDALFQFSPFYFVIEASVWLGLRVLGFDLLSVHVDLGLEGPTPWHAYGTGHLAILFFDISADFDVTWSDSADTTLPPIAVVPLLVAELEKRENWTAALPARSRLSVSLRRGEAGADLVLHPLGTLRFTQRALPLNLTLDKIGSQRPSDANRFELHVSGGNFEKRGEVREKFALAQFQDMSDAEKLSRPSFETAVGGLDVKAGSDLSVDHVARRVVRYEEVIVDSEYKRHQRKAKPYVALFVHELESSVVGKNQLSQAARLLLDPFAGDTVQVLGERFSIVGTDTNRLHAAAALEFESVAEAREHLGQLLRAKPGLSGKLQVIPVSEAA